MVVRSTGRAGLTRAIDRAIGQGGGRTLVEIPVDFNNWDFPEVQIYKTGTRRYTATVDTAALTPTTNGNVYVTSVSGNDTNDGLTSANSVASLDRAVIVARGKIEVADNFNRADEVLTADANWTLLLGAASPTIVSNQLASGSPTHQIVVYDAETNTANQEVEIEVITLTAGRNVGVALRVTETECYMVWVENDSANTFRIYHWDGSFTLLQTVNTTAPTTPFTFRGQIQDGVIKGFVDDVEVISHTLTTDLLPNARGVGVYLNATGQVIDDFAAGDITGTPITIPKFVFSSGTYTLSETLPADFVFEKSGTGVASVSAAALIAPAIGTDAAIIGMRFTTGVEFDGGNQLIKDCLFEDTTPGSSNSIHLIGTGKAVVMDTEVTGGGRDGISGRDSKQILELRCNVHGNGSNVSDNSSTMHTSSRAVRIDGDYYDAPRVVHDVNNSRSVNLGCRYRDSNGTAEEGSSFLVGAGFSTIGSETVKLWMYGCTLSGTAFDDIYGDTDTEIFVDSETLYDSGKVSANADITLI